MQTPEEMAREVLRMVGDGDQYVSPHAVLDLIRARDAEVRADERANAPGWDAALRAWTNAGPRPDVHKRAKDVVRKTMPVLARALDEGERGLA